MPNVDLSLGEVVLSRALSSAEDMGCCMATDACVVASSRGLNPCLDAMDDGFPRGLVDLDGPERLDGTWDCGWDNTCCGNVMGWLWEAILIPSK